MKQPFQISRSRGMIRSDVLRFPNSLRSLARRLLVMLVMWTLAGNLYSAPGKQPIGFYPGDPIPDNTVYLTFDDGPSDWTNRILDTLKSRNVRATFFICANWMPRSTNEYNSFRRYRPTLERMIREGHAIGNHSRSHQNFTPLTSSQIARQLDSNQEIFNRELGEFSFPLTLIRPPFGDPWMSSRDEETILKTGRVIYKRGLIILWSRHFNILDSMDWVQGDWYREGDKINIRHEEFQARMNTIYNRVFSKAKGNGMVILLHDTHRTTAEVLPRIIDKLLEMGYEFQTIEDYVLWRWNKSSLEIARDQASEN